MANEEVLSGIFYGKLKRAIETAEAGAWTSLRGASGAGFGIGLWSPSALME